MHFSGEHNHHTNNSHSHFDHHHRAVKNIRLAFFLNLSFTVIEIVGGILTNSLAILSDALHDLGDSISLALSWRLERVSQRGRSKRFTYGYRRFSLLAAVINSLILIGGSIYIISQAIPRLFAPEAVVSEGMLGLAVLGVLVNGVAVLRLRGGKKLNERVVMLHLLEDVFGWVAVLVIALVIHFTDLRFLDPLLSIGIAVFVSVKVFHKLVQSMRIFLQSVPSNMDTRQVYDALREIEEIVDLHDIHLWSLDGEYNIGTIHIVVRNDISPDEVLSLKQKVREIMYSYGVSHATIEIETEDEYCDYKSC
jgi:cobalt-zinc-cadmium efflux system protein